jgi:hypothetical protein
VKRIALAALCAAFAACEGARPPEASSPALPGTPGAPATAAAARPPRGTPAPPVLADPVALPPAELFAGCRATIRRDRVPNRSGSVDVEDWRVECDSVRLLTNEFPGMQERADHLLDLYRSPRSASGASNRVEELAVVVWQRSHAAVRMLSPTALGPIETLAVAERRDDRTKVLVCQALEADAPGRRRCETMIAFVLAHGPPHGVVPLVASAEELPPPCKATAVASPCRP